MRRLAMKGIWILGLVFCCIPVFAKTQASSSLKKLCPMEIRAAGGIGPLNFKTSAVSVQALFPEARTESIPASARQGPMTFIEISGLHVSYCKDQVQDIWVDLDQLPHGCLTFNNRPLPAKSSVSRLKSFLGGCPEEEVRTGGTFYKCAEGLRLGLCGPQGQPCQIRVGDRLSAACLP